MLSEEDLRLWQEMMRALGRGNSVVVPESDRFPHTCACGAAAYVGAYEVDCSVRCGLRRGKDQR
jgi:hypothetical protein